MYEDDDGNKKRVGDIKSVDRDWTFLGDTVTKGEIKVNVIYPDTKAKGAVFFMHGFSQYPVAYADTLKKVADEAEVAVFAVETGVASGVSQGPSLFSNKQFYLQRAVSQDTQQIIDMMKAGKEPFASYVDKDVPVGLCGHSMGGGLCNYVAADNPFIDYVFTMSPALGVAPFEPVNATKRGVPDNSINLAGTWDFIAPKGKVKAIVESANQKKPGSAIYGPINRGLHTGFESKLVILSVPLSWIAALVLNFSGLVEIIVLKLFRALRTNTGQLDIAETLMSFFFKQMAEGKKVTVKDATAALDGLPDRWEDKIELSEP